MHNDIVYFNTRHNVVFEMNDYTPHDLFQWISTIPIILGSMIELRDSSKYISSYVLIETFSLFIFRHFALMSFASFQIQKIKGKFKLYIKHLKILVELDLLHHDPLQQYC